MDKLRIIQEALVFTGNDRINALFDGSDEWQVADTGFEAGLKSLVAAGIGPFSSDIVTLQRTGDSEDPNYRDAYLIPNTVWHLRGIKTSDGYPLSMWRILDGKVLVSLNGSSSILAEVIKEPEGDANWHAMAEDVLRKRVEVACLRGLNEDFNEARNREREAEKLLIQAQTRGDQQNPPKRGYRSRMTDVRRTRRV